MSFKPIEPKRDEFRKYLEHCGIIEALTKVFSKLIAEEERPSNPLEYIREHLGDTVLQFGNIAHLNAELEAARLEIQTLKSLVDQKEIRNMSKTENASSEPNNQSIEVTSVASSIDPCEEN